MLQLNKDIFDADFCNNTAIGKKIRQIKVEKLQKDFKKHLGFSSKPILNKWQKIFQKLLA